jgi:hypothetical protein
MSIFRLTFFNRKKLNNCQFFSFFSILSTPSRQVYAVLGGFILLQAEKPWLGLEALNLLPVLAVATLQHIQD